MKVLVCGTGAMGSLFSGSLSAAGHDVTVLGTWNAALDRISTQGISLFRGDELLLQTDPLRTFRSVNASDRFDLVLILVKTFQTVDLLPRLMDLPGITPLLTFQNGYGNRERISANLPNEVWAGVTNIGATLIGPGEARWVGDGGTIMPDLPILREMFGDGWKCPIMTHFVQDTNRAIWDKLIINAAINPITAIYKVKNGELLRPSEARDRMLAIANECAAVAVGMGLEIRLAEILDRLDQVLGATSDNRSSMLSDVLRGGRTEIDSINGAVIQAGRSVGVDVYENERVLAEVKRLSSLS